MFLVDTNIFLEILLEQEKKEDCKAFLKKNSGAICISDFSLHSIGVILFRNKKPELFSDFIKDTMPNVRIITLPADAYQDLPKTKKKFGSDFDDSYQYLIAKNLKLDVVTLDSDFKGFSDLNVKFL